jgi:hypothetical protein
MTIYSHKLFLHFITAKAIGSMVHKRFLTVNNEQNQLVWVKCVEQGDLWP